MARADEAQGDEAREFEPVVGQAADGPGHGISEDWAATILGLVLLLLTLIGVIGKGMVP